MTDSLRLLALMQLNVKNRVLSYLYSAKNFSILPWSPSLFFVLIIKPVVKRKFNLGKVFSQRNDGMLVWTAGHSFSPKTGQELFSPKFWFRIYCSVTAKSFEKIHSLVFSVYYLTFSFIRFIKALAKFFM